MPFQLSKHSLSRSTHTLWKYLVTPVRLMHIIYSQTQQWPQRLSTFNKKQYLNSLILILLPSKPSESKFCGLFLSSILESQYNFLLSQARIIRRLVPLYMCYHKGSTLHKNTKTLLDVKILTKKGVTHHVRCI